jgi:hypothetical protein
MNHGLFIVYMSYGDNGLKCNIVPIISNQENISDIYINKKILMIHVLTRKNIVGIHTRVDENILNF